MFNVSFLYNFTQFYLLKQGGENFSAATGEPKCVKGKKSLFRPNLNEYFGHSLN